MVTGDTACLLRPGLRRPFGAQPAALSHPETVPQPCTPLSLGLVRPGGAPGRGALAGQCPLRRAQTLGPETRFQGPPRRESPNRLRAPVPGWPPRPRPQGLGTDWSGQGAGVRCSLNCNSFTPCCASGAPCHYKVTWSRPLSTRRCQVEADAVAGAGAQGPGGRGHRCHLRAERMGPARPLVGTLDFPGLVPVPLSCPHSPRDGPRLFFSASPRAVAASARVRCPLLAMSRHPARGVLPGQGRRVPAAPRDTGSDGDRAGDDAPEGWLLRVPEWDAPLCPVAGPSETVVVSGQEDVGPVPTGAQGAAWAGVPGRGSWTCRSRWPWQL